jgi:hypothetical protein
MDSRLFKCQDGRFAVGELPGLSKVIGYIAENKNGTWRVEAADRVSLSETAFATQNDAAMFVFNLKSTQHFSGGDAGRHY